MASYIPDGYTEKGYIEGVPRLYEALRFKFRPMRIEDGSEFLDLLSKMSAKPREGEVFTAKMLAKRVLEWDLKDKGQTLPLDVKTLLGVQRRLFYRLMAIVLGTDASDMDPAWSEQEQDEFLERKATAFLEEKPIGQVAAERDAKNS